MELRKERYGVNATDMEEGVDIVDRQMMTSYQEEIRRLQLLSESRDKGNHYSKQMRENQGSNKQSLGRNGVQA